MYDDFHFQNCNLGIEVFYDVRNQKNLLYSGFPMTNHIKKHQWPITFRIVPPPCIGVLPSRTCCCGVWFGVALLYCSFMTVDPHWDWFCKSCIFHSVEWKNYTTQACFFISNHKWSHSKNKFRQEFLPGEFGELAVLSTLSTNHRDAARNPGLAIARPGLSQLTFLPARGSRPN